MKLLMWSIVRRHTPRRKNEKENTGIIRHNKRARYAIDNGATKAARHFSEKLGTKLNESTVLQQKQNKAEILTEVASKPRGRPKILNDELDKDVCDYIRSLREESGVINSSIVQSVSRGVVLSKQKTLLPEYGGSLELSREWARSILDCLNFRKRKATKGVKHLPEDFEKTKRETY
jgi:hypothetical protein